MLQQKPFRQSYDKTFVMCRGKKKCAEKQYKGIFGTARQPAVLVCTEKETIDTEERQGDFICRVIGNPITENIPARLRKTMIYP